MQVAQRRRRRQLYSVVNSAQSDEKRLITVNVHEECYFFDFLHRLIFVICLKCLPSAHMRVLSRECHWSMDASVVHCSMKGMINATNKILH